MRTKPIIFAAIAGFALASVITLQHGELRATPEADALFLGRTFRSIGRTVRGAVRTVTRTASRVGRAVGKAVSRTGKAVGKAATAVGKKVGKATTAVGKAVGRGVKAVGKGIGDLTKGALALAKKGVAGLQELAKKGLEGLKAMGELVKKGLLALKDLLEFVWKTLKNKLLKPVADFFKNMIQKAKAAMKKLVDKALTGLKSLFQTKVLEPAIAWALQRIFPAGNATLAKIKAFVQRILGKAQALVARGNEMADAMQALAEKNYTKYKAALARFEEGLNRWTSVGLKEIAAEIVASLKGKLVEFVRGKTVDLLDKAYTLVEVPINAGKAAAIGAIASIPFVGGAIAGAADVVITQGMSMLRDAGFKFIADKAGALAGMVVDKIGSFVVRGAAALDAKLRPIVTKIKPYIDQALGIVNQVKAKWFLLRDKMRQAGNILAAAQAAVR